MALTLIERVLKRYPRTGGTYVDMTYTEIQNPNFTVDVSKPPLTRIMVADFPERYIVGYTRIVNDFATTIDDIEPETMDMVVCDEVIVPESNPNNLMIARHNGYCYIKVGVNYYLSMKPYQTVVTIVNGLDEQMSKILEEFGGEVVVLVTPAEEIFPYVDHDWIQVLEARTVHRFTTDGTPFKSYPFIKSLLGKFIEIPEDKLPTFPEGK